MLLSNVSRFEIEYLIHYRERNYGFMLNEKDYVKQQFPFHFETRLISRLLQDRRKTVNIIPIVRLPHNKT